MGVFRDILVAYDASPGATAALEHAGRLAVDQHARLTVMAVARPLPSTAGLTPAPVASEDPRLGREQELAAVVPTLPADIGVTTIVAYGPPADRILERARTGGHDLIVLGSRGHGRMHDALLGCVSRTVLHGSPVPVLIIPVPAVTMPAPELTPGGVVLTLPV